MFNKYKVYEGEKVLKELIAQHPNDPYYHEALVQLQQQVPLLLQDLKNIQQPMILEQL
jgi:predicted Zn-dependent protease